MAFWMIAQHCEGPGGTLFYFSCTTPEEGGQDKDKEAENKQGIGTNIAAKRKKMEMSAAKLQSVPTEASRVAGERDQTLQLPLCCNELI